MRLIRSLAVLGVVIQLGIRSRTVAAFDHIIENRVPILGYSGSSDCPDQTASHRGRYTRVIGACRTPDDTLLASASLTRSCRFP